MGEILGNFGQIVVNANILNKPSDDTGFVYLGVDVVAAVYDGLVVTTVEMGLFDAVVGGDGGT